MVLGLVSALVSALVLVVSDYPQAWLRPCLLVSDDVFALRMILGR